MTERAIPLLPRPPRDPADRRRGEVTELVGDTPLVRLGSLEPGPGVEVHAKTEWVNPGGSVKDRAALRIVLEAEAAGELGPERTLIDASSGNTGIAYAMLGAAFGFPVTIVIPGSAGASRLRRLRAYGAELILTPAEAAIDGAIDEVRRRVARDPDRYFYPDQYGNPANWRAHYDGTGPEILRQTGGRVTHFVAALGTTGTLMGTGRRLREARPGVRLIGVQPDSPLHAMEGLKHLESSRHVPGLYDPSLVDRLEVVSTEEAREAAIRLAREQGILVGPSGGAAAVAAARVAANLHAGCVVTVFPDGGERYLEEPFWSLPR